MNFRFRIISLILGIILICGCITPEEKTETKEWTLMFYDDADFFQASNLREPFEEDAHSGENLNVLILEDTETGPASTWYVQEDGRSVKVKDNGEVNMASSETLRDFIAFCKERYPAKRYMLLLYGHGAGWQGACVDTTSSPDWSDWLTPEEMRQALTETGGIDIIGFSAPCLMGAIEPAYELRDCVDVYIGSEETSGYIYWWDSIKPICETLNKSTKLSNIELGDAIIEIIKENYPDFKENHPGIDLNTEGITMSAIRTDRIEALTEAMDGLARDLLPKLSSYEEIVDVWYATQSFGGGEMIDVYDLANQYILWFPEASGNAQNVKQALNETVINEVYDDLHPDAHGLSIYFPVFPASDPYDETYATCGLDFARDTYWDEFLSAFYRSMKNVFGFEEGKLLQNGGFESVLNRQPSFWETVAMDKQNWVFSVDNVVKHSGNTSASIEGKGNWAYWMQHFEGDAIPAGREVTVSGYVKTEDVDQRAEIWIYCVDSDGNPTETVTAPISGTKDWTFVTASQRIPEDAVRMDIDLFIWGPGKVWFDDIQLVTEGKWAQKPVAEKPDAALAKAYGSYIVSQKEPEPSGWFKAMIPAEGLVMSWKDSTSHTGKRCVSISNKHLYDEPVYNNWAQNIEFAHKEKKIELSGWIKTENVTGGGASLIVQCIGENYTLLADRSTKGVDGTTNWTLYNASITVPAETTNLTVRAVLVGTGKVWFDDVQLRATETHGGSTNLLKNSDFEEDSDFEEGEGMLFFSPPINYESQALLGFWMESEPSGYIKEWRFERDAGPNYVVEVDLKQIPAGEEVKVNWYAYVFTKAFDYSTLPENAPISDLRGMPEDVKRWLEPTEAVQSDHPEIVAKAKELRGDSDDIMEIARQITNFVGKEIEGGGGMQDALTTLRTGEAACTGHANLAAALFRANGIPCRILAVSSISQLQTHYIVEFYAPSYGWVLMESTMGIMPYQPTDVVLLRLVYPEDENETPQNAVPGVPKNTTIDSTPNVNVGHGLSESCYQGREILHRYWGDEEEIAAAYSRTKELGDRSIRGLEMDLQAIRSVEECSTIEEYIAFLDLYSSGK